eukprot:scaffold33846_cov101-Isochrysis_galbana.AAC.1
MVGTDSCASRAVGSWVTGTEHHYTDDGRGRPVHLCPQEQGWGSRLCRTACSALAVHGMHAQKWDLSMPGENVCHSSKVSV